MKLSAAASTADRVTSWMVWKREQNCPVLLNYILKISLMNSVTIIIMPCVKAGAVYEHKYLLGTSMARPVIAKKLVEIARKEGATTICHGATGKGNDQIRFELAIKALAPDLKIIAPWRMTDVWTMQSREDEIEYCKKHGIDLPFDHSHSYSRDRNLWHISHEGLELEDPANEPNYRKHAGAWRDTGTSSG